MTLDRAFELIRIVERAAARMGMYPAADKDSVDLKSLPMTMPSSEMQQLYEVIHSGEMAELRRWMKSLYVVSTDRLSDQVIKGLMMEILAETMDMVMSRLVEYINRRTNVD